MKRRTLLYGGAATLAAITGAGVAWWDMRPCVTASANAAAFWNLNFETPDGQLLAMSNFYGQPLLVNFWGTWCPPCVEELPLLDGFYRSHKAKNWRVLGLAVDQPGAVRRWLQLKPLSFAIAMAGMHGTELSKSLGNMTGSLPFTAVFDANGQLQHRKIGQVTSQELEFWSRSLA